jgi:uroporphyrin-III C-methyltransferase
MPERPAVHPVAIVGAGPGDPDLLTVRAARLLSQATVVLHDRLLDPAVLDLVPRDAHLVDVGKGPDGGTHQDVINDLLVLSARAGERVVRLKAGDPFVFGRGREEADALEAAGLPWVVVPGLTSAFAGPAAVGVPVTHRGDAATVTVVTAARRPGEPDADWSALATLATAGGTLVVLMGVRRRADIAALLIGAGAPADLPVVAVERATHPGQRHVCTRLDRLGEVEVESPAVIVIGVVARHASAAARVAAETA